MREQLRQYAVALTVTLIVFSLLSLYLFLRRGYYTIYITNKATGSAALIIIGIVLLIGPLSRLYQRFDSWLTYRKELGILGFFLAFLHAVISYFFLSNYFPVAYFWQKNLPSFLAGLASLLLLILLWIFSWEKVAAKMAKGVWWKWQYRGVRLAAILLFLHLVVMKYPGWFKWFAKGGSEELVRPYLPPGSFIAGSFGFFVLAARLVELAGTKIARAALPLLLALLLFTWAGSLLGGKDKTPAPLPLRWETCLKLPGSFTLESYPPVCVAPDGRHATQPSL